MPGSRKIHPEFHENLVFKSLTVLKPRKCPLAGAHQREHLSPLLPWVNPFPSRFILRTAFSRNGKKKKWRTKAITIQEPVHWLFFILPGVAFPILGIHKWKLMNNQTKHEVMEFSQACGGQANSLLMVLCSVYCRQFPCKLCEKCR